MNRALAFCSVLAIALFSSQLHAVEKYTFYLGGSLGAMTHDMNISYDTIVEDGTTASYEEKGVSTPAFGLITGFNIFPWLAAELQYTITQSDSILGATTDIQTQSIGLFGVYRKGDELFAKVRFGLASRDIDISAPAKAGFTGTVEGSQSATTGALGLGVGHELPVGTIELMYMYYPNMKVDSDELEAKTDINVSDRFTTDTWSIGYTYTF